MRRTYSACVVTVKQSFPEHGSSATGEGKKVVGVIALDAVLLMWQCVLVWMPCVGLLWFLVAVRQTDSDERATATACSLSSNRRIG